MAAQLHAWKFVILVILRFNSTFEHSVRSFDVSRLISKCYTLMTFFFAFVVILAAFKTKINCGNSSIYCTRGSFSKRVWRQGSLSNFFSSFFISIIITWALAQVAWAGWDEGYIVGPIPLVTRTKILFSASYKSEVVFIFFFLTIDAPKFVKDSCILVLRDGR